MTSKKTKNTERPNRILYCFIVIVELQNDEVLLNQNRGFSAPVIALFIPVSPCVHLFINGHSNSPVDFYEFDNQYKAH